MQSGTSSIWDVPLAIFCLHLWLEPRYSLFTIKYSLLADPQLNDFSHHYRTVTVWCGSRQFSCAANSGYQIQKHANRFSFSTPFLLKPFFRSFEPMRTILYKVSLLPQIFELPFCIFLNIYIWKPICTAVIILIACCLLRCFDHPKIFPQVNGALIGCQQCIKFWLVIGNL